MAENTFPLSSSVKQNTMNSSMWSSKMANIYFGMCHTFIYPDKVTADTSQGHYFTFYLDPHISYRIIIHDPRFYHVVEREVFPRIWLEYKPERDMKAGHMVGYFITVTEHHLLNRPEDPCHEEEEEEDYDFLQCLKTSLARPVGCRPPWDSWSPPSVPLCETMEQLHQYETLDLGYLEQELVIMLNNSGCKIPCKHKVRLS